LHQVSDLFELNVKLRCQKVNSTHTILHTGYAVEGKYFGRLKMIKLGVSVSHPKQNERPQNSFNFSHNNLACSFAKHKRI